MTTKRSLPLLTAAALVAGASALLTTPARAQDDVIAPGPGMNGLPDDDVTKWGLGVGVGVQRQPYTGIESKTRVLPLFFFENRYVRFLGLGGDIKLPPAGPVSFALRLRYANQGYEASDAPILDGMAERKGALLAGAVGMWRTGRYGVVTAEVLGDVTGRSNGTQARIGYDIPLRAGNFTFSPNVAAVLLDRKTVDYYYGVTADEARNGRPRYDGRRTLNAELGVRTGYALTSNQSVTLDLGATFFGGGIEDSPLVDRRSQPNVRLGYVYRF